MRQNGLPSDKLSPLHRTVKSLSKGSMLSQASINIDLASRRNFHSLLYHFSDMANASQNLFFLLPGRGAVFQPGSRDESASSWLWEGSLPRRGCHAQASEPCPPATGGWRALASCRSAFRPDSKPAAWSLPSVLCCRKISPSTDPRAWLRQGRRHKKRRPLRNTS